MKPCIRASATLVLLLLAACSDSVPTSASLPVTTPPPPANPEPPAPAVDPCLDPDATIDPACFVTGNAASIVRTICGAAWLPGVCNAVAFEEPDYTTDADPSPGKALFLTIGALHEHSSYSDGDPTLIPRDYFTAGRTGFNTADDGSDRGLRLDFMISSEHSDNEALPVTTSTDCIPGGGDPAAALTGLSGDILSNLLSCLHLGNLDHAFKWQATLQQAQEGSDATFTAMRGFEWTNDLYNHMNVYFSTHVVNAKIDGSYLGMNFMWSWLQTPVDQGGGADALAVFNHPGGDPKLSPFDGGLPHTQLLAALGGANWNDLAYVPEVDARVVGMEVNRGDDLSWFVKALQKGWHLGPVGAEDEHQREWSSARKPKTVMLTRGRTPQDYYWAMQNRRTQSLQPELLGGLPGTGDKARFPQIEFFANGTDLQSGTPLGAILREPGAHTLHIRIAGLPVSSPVVLIGREQGQAQPIALGTADAQGALIARHPVTAPVSGEDWYFVVVCPVGEAECGSSENYLAVTAPIWFGPG